LRQEAKTEKLKILNNVLKKGIEARAELLYPALLEIYSVHGWYGARGMA
jgi:hypothetical protein